MKQRMTGFMAFILLVSSYLVIRYPLFELHGMNQWPLLLFALSAAVSFLSISEGNNTVCVATMIGYAGGFAIARLLAVEGTDPGGGRTSNLWQIWTAVLVVAIVVGFIISIIKKKNKRST